MNVTCKRNWVTFTFNLVEEIADVEFMVEQVKMLNGICEDEMAVAKLTKAVRTLERLGIPFEEIALSKGEELVVSQGEGVGDGGD